MKEAKNQLHILVRYLILFSLMFSLPSIYKILTPITITFSATLLDIFYNISISGDIIIIDFLNITKFIQIIPACIAGSAYLLLLILNLTVSMTLKKRIYSIVFSFLLLFTLNILRIFILSILYINNSILFEATHKLFWYILSTLFVVLIWFLMVKIYLIKEIPLYSDFKFLIKKINSKTKN